MRTRKSPTSNYSIVSRGHARSRSRGCRACRNGRGMAVGARTVLPLYRRSCCGGRRQLHTTWLRDAFLRGQRDGTPIYAKCRASKPGADQADWLSASDGTPVVEITDVFLEGGDCLVGPDFWLVGKSAVKRTAEITGHLCDEATALARIAALDCRPLCVVGYRNVETRTVSPAPLHDLAQGWAHIDLVVSLTGRKPRGTKGSLMIAETQLSPKPDRYEIAERDRLNALARASARMRL